MSRLFIGLKRGSFGFGSFLALARLFRVGSFVVSGSLPALAWSSTSIRWDTQVSLESELLFKSRHNSKPIEFHVIDAHGLSCGMGQRKGETNHS